MKPSLPHHIGTIALAAVLAAGCSSLPTEPVVGETGATQGVDHGGAAVATVSPAAFSAPSSDEPVSHLIDTPPVGTAVIHGKKGGELSAGIFKIVVPPGAWNGNGTITMKQPNLSKPRVELSIVPSSKNNFAVPVMLVVDIDGVNPSRFALLGMSGHDAATGQWTAASGVTIDAYAMTMSIPLTHFSEYRVDVGGLPGW